MRKLLIKMFVGNYIEKGNVLTSLAHLMLFVTISLFWQGYPMYGLASITATVVMYIVGRIQLRDNVQYAHRLRSSYILWPLAVLIGNLSITNPGTLVHMLSIVFGGLFLLPEWYFWRYPVLWSEMDDTQKLNYGYGVQSGTIKGQLTPVQFEEWLKLKNRNKV